MIFEETGITDPATFTDEGKKLRDQTLAAESVARRWVQQLAANNFDDVHFATLTPEERKTAPKIRQQYLLAGLALGPVPALDVDLAAKEYLESRQHLLTGGLIRIEDKVFWSPSPELRQLVEAEIKAIFNPGRFKHRRLDMPRSGQPVVTRDNQRIRFGFDLKINIPRDDPAQPHLDVEARVIVGADLAELSTRKLADVVWRSRGAGTGARSECPAAGRTPAAVIVQRHPPRPGTPGRGVGGEGKAPEQ